MNANPHLAPAPKIAEQFGISRRTLSRWISNDQLGFPRAVEINGRLYFEQEAIDAWKLSRSRHSVMREAA